MRGNRRRFGGGAVPVAPVPEVPTLAELDKYNVTGEKIEAIGNTLYDSAVYAAAGQTQLTFFNLPIGQGTGFGGGTKTLMDTNMTNASMLPQNVQFLLEWVEVLFLPTTPSVAAQMPAAFGAQAIAQIVNDAFIFYRVGNLRLQIGQKDYIQEAPLMKFPPLQNFDVSAALADVTTAGANLQSRIAFATARGRPYFLRSPIRIVSGQNFGVTLNWDTVQAITNPARVFLTLGGILYRRSQ